MDENIGILVKRLNEQERLINNLICAQGEFVNILFNARSTDGKHQQKCHEAAQYLQKQEKLMGEIEETLRVINSRPIGRLFHVRFNKKN